jgi:hypothetical protein
VVPREWKGYAEQQIQRYADDQVGLVRFDLDKPFIIRSSGRSWAFAENTPSVAQNSQPAAQLTQRFNIARTLWTIVQRPRSAASWPL